MERHSAPNTGNSKQDQKYAQQQEKLQQRQTQEREKLQQQQEKEHQNLAKQNANDARKQQTEQKHAQQTQQLQQRHVQQQQKLQQRQAPRGPSSGRSAEEVTLWNRTSGRIKKAASADGAAFLMIKHAIKIL